MEMEPYEWNVVVVGYWNPAILTPAGIAKRLFGLEEGTPILVEVPMGGLASPRVKYDDLTVTAEGGRLVVNVDKPIFANLEKAKMVAVRAINDLPETPFKAAGFNVRYRISEPSDELLAGTETGIDALLSDSSFIIQAKILNRSLTWEEGVVNLTLHSEPEAKIEMNFHKQSIEQKELSDWLSKPIGPVEQTVSKILTKVIDIKPEGTDK
ncbi:MAG: hypothetical protein K8S55_13500 [Phycisphaerae bacterium]|nr:hypothetical protein [Phycisphaerae bacterium]